MKRTLFSICVCLGNYLSAYLSPGPCSFGIQGEYLYFSPLLENTTFVLNSTPTGLPDDFDQGTLIRNNPRFASGGRIEGAIGLPDQVSSLHTRFTFLKHRSHTTVRGEQLFLTSIPSTGFLPFLTVVPPEITIANGFAGVATSRIGVRYFAGEGYWEGRLLQGPCLELSFLTGIHYANIRTRERIDASGTVPLFGTAVAVEQSNGSRFWGIGPEIGFDFSYLVFGCPGWNLGLVSGTRAGLLIGKVDNHFFYTDGTPFNTTTLDNRNFWKSTPFFDGRLGVDFELENACFCANLEVGYEMIWYHHVSYRPNFPARTDAALLTESNSDISFHGPYVALGIVF